MFSLSLSLTRRTFIPKLQVIRVLQPTISLELAGDLVLEGVELIHELLAGILVEHVPVHEPGGVAEADELHHLGELFILVWCMVRNHDGWMDGCRGRRGGGGGGGVI